MIRAVLLASVLVSIASATFGMIEMPSVIYVKPGDDFTIPCSSDFAVVTKLFLPSEEMPSEEIKREQAVATGNERKKNTASSLFENANAEEHEGLYTCVVNHGSDMDPMYSEATCKIIVKDICGESDCSGLEKCVPDYSTGTYECSCEYECSKNFDPICADTCDLYWNECAMNEMTCRDGKEREIMNTGFCPVIVSPTVRDVPDVQVLSVKVGEMVTMHSGLVEDGTPRSLLQWTFNGELMEGENGEQLVIEARRSCLSPYIHSLSFSLLLSLSLSLSTHRSNCISLSLIRGLCFYSRTRVVPDLVPSMMILNKMIRAVLLASVLVSIASATFGMIEMPSVIYVKPGDDFTIPCSSDFAVVTKLFLPSEEMPSEEIKREQAVATGNERKKNTASSLFENANAEEHEGLYTCVVTYECSCEYECSKNFDPICADTCDLYWNECAMNEMTCRDGKEREIMNTGFCPVIVSPTVRDVPDVQVLSVKVGEMVTMHSGLVEDGTPRSLLQWTFNGELMEGENGEQLVIEASEGSAGEYMCTITHCKNDNQATMNQYKVEVPEYPTDELSTVPPTSDDFTISDPKYTCSAYPGGSLETFNGEVTVLDLTCSHVLAADLGRDSGYVDSWYIYGSFDDFQGRVALQSMTFYIGGAMFEIQRGWLVNMNGDKWAIKETGVAQAVPGTNCTIEFVDWHLEVACADFTAYYDGIMSGTLSLEVEVDAAEIEKRAGNDIGLCWDNMWGARSNWQVGANTGKCELNQEFEVCDSGDIGCVDYQVESDNAEFFATCGAGAVDSCSELTCNESGMTSMQQCALIQARDKSCALKGATGGDVSRLGCPENECDWFLAVVAEGCPQDSFPFQCGEIDA
eukprot:sb/3462004/